MVREEILTDESAHNLHSTLLKDARPFEFELQKAWGVYASQKR